MSKLPKITSDTIIVGPNMDKPNDIVRGRIMSFELSEEGLFFDIRLVDNPNKVVAVWSHESHIEE